MIPSSLTPTFPEMNLYEVSISGFLFFSHLRDVARVLPLFKEMRKTDRRRVFMDR